MMESPKKILAYRPPERDGPGCGQLVLETVGGMMLLAMCGLGAGSLHRAIGGGLGVAAEVALFVAVGGLLVFFAFMRRPGLLIGFLLAGGVLLFLNMLCGRFV